MKIKIKHVSYEQVLQMKKPKHKRPKKPSFLFSTIIRALAIPDLIATRFKYTKERMEPAPTGPYLILMNHSSFIDLKIASKIFYPMPYNIVCTSDALVGKEWLMRNIGCIPTQKFVSDITLISDIIHSIKKNRTSVLMYPEAGYTFDGCATPLPRGLGRLFKKLDVPILTVITDGAFLRDPLYNNLQLRKVNVTATLKCLFTQQEVRDLSVEQLDARLDEAFTFDNFENQFKTKTVIDEPFRADGLERLLYRCSECETEDKMEGLGTVITCKKCSKQHTLNIYGKLEAKDGKTRFSHIPDWYNWQRECVKHEIESGKYKLDIDVKIGVLKDYKAIYMVGDGHLYHDINGFKLTGCEGKLEYTQSPLASYELNADYYWYEIGDVISIGNKDLLYYCFPKDKVNVAKVRFAAEEIYKIQKERTRKIKNG